MFGNWLDSFSQSISSFSARNDETPELTHAGSLASFIFLITGLQRRLNDPTLTIFNSRGVLEGPRSWLGSGQSFSVERAEWKNASTGASHGNLGDFVAVKFFRRTEENMTNWNTLLLEIRALLHEPIRYHPNIVRFLGIHWGAMHGSIAMFPVLMLEYAKFGTLDDFQASSGPLEFEVKKKLCHDVSKGLSILHACGVVHGDLKPRNVLIFSNKDESATVFFTAKLSDFGGSVMDLTENHQRLRVYEENFGPPEYRETLDAEGLKLTDAYSFGFLVWRTFLDGENPFKLPVLANSSPDEIKCTDGLYPIAQQSVRLRNTTTHDQDLQIIDFVLENTIRTSPQHRNLIWCVAALQASKYVLSF